VASGLVVGLLLLIAVFAQLLAPYDYTAQDVDYREQPPTLAHPMGTDSLGRDVLSRAIFGARVSLGVGLLSVAIAMLSGVPLGAAAGYFGGRLDLAVTWLLDLILAFPGLVLAIAITAMLGPSLLNTALAIGVVNVPGFARLVRSSVLSLREREFVEAARCLGASHGHIIVRHILPNVTGLVIVRATAGLGFAILTEAGLSFIGLGAQPPDPSWGGMLNEGRDALRRAPFLATLPGLCIMVTVLAFNLLGDGLRDALDPRLER
jgi:peptide/nickel transport system permease protein